MMGILGIGERLLLFLHFAYTSTQNAGAKVGVTTLLTVDLLFDLFSDGSDLGDLLGIGESLIE